MERFQMTHHFRRPWERKLYRGATFQAAWKTKENECATTKEWEEMRIHSSREAEPGVMVTLGGWSYTSTNN